MKTNEHSLPTAPTISIVVLNWNTSDLLGGALNSIVDTAEGLNYEVMVIDNASTDGGFSILNPIFKQNPHFSFIQNKTNMGWAAVNIMLERTKGEYIVTIDPDAVIHPHALQELLAFMKSHGEAGAATASLFNVDGTPQFYYRRLTTPLLYFFTTVLGRVIDKYLCGLRNFNSYRYTGIDVTRVSEVEQPAWPCLMWRRIALGPYIVDEHIPFYFLDVDMSKRLYDSGYKIYLVPGAQVTHLKSTSYGRANTTWRQREYYRSLTFYLRKHYGHALFILLPMLWFDRVLRACIQLIIGREPLR